ncbi:SidA/IucD/PvdA family monooxygenase [Amycolatopsis pithecellobii]|uniref:L-lysine N6-monooxygenase MbtG n=1 Tax=Amycolatopsis pithecellobii TaxID=664692 RepID=A0A6N7YU71_9PSEU|nr:SidA/IucD/PvdA family monooxygenase [Amycolatopsis pithecellobii]MTD52393.1 SidA/IucD/PvdA family monooxygenase [Amycolatopsis pithecellobii]
MSSNRVHDLVVAGFGPAGISLAVAAADHDEARPADRLDAVYLERAGDSSWQPNLMLAGTDIQHHFLRDFATPVNPRSRFTFPSYLVGTGRFYPFTLLGGYASRREWSGYIEWAARESGGAVDYHREVTEVRPVQDRDGRVRSVEVISVDPRDGAEHRHRGRNVAISTGHQPWVPALFRPSLGDRVFHAQEFLPRLSLLPDGPLRIAVVGAGQSAGEILLHLAAAHPDHELYALTRNAGFRMYELGHFSNEVYFPQETDYFYGLDRDRRERAFAGAKATNYAAVDPDVSTALYQAVYDDRLAGRNRWHIQRRTEVTKVDVQRQPVGRPSGVRLELAEVNSGAEQALDVDAVVLSTGFSEPRIPDVLRPVQEYLLTDESGDPVVTRAYRVQTRDDFEAGIYLNGITEWRHGISSATSFSVMAVKADTIHRDLRERLALGSSRTGSRAEAPAAR